LPNLINKFIEGGTVGTSHTAGLPNIIGESPIVDTAGILSSIATPTGAFKKGTQSNFLADGRSGTGFLLGFDASRSSSIYGNSQIVQPASLEMTYCIKY